MRTNIIKILHNDLNDLLKNPFVDLNQLQGTVYRAQPGRKTIAFTYHNKRYFAKIHTGVGWWEISKNILQLRWPIVSAAPEWNALLKLKALGVRAPIPVAFGKQGINPARLKSFIITEAVLATMNLEEFLTAQGPVEFKLKKRLIESVAHIAKTLHENGMNHRDFYLCHFLLDTSRSDLLNPQLYLIDLHRAHIRKKTPLRWKIKDISGLYFSTLNFNFTKRDYLRFIRSYSGQPLRQALGRNKLFWQIVTRKAHKLYRKMYLHSPPFSRVAGEER